MKQLALLLMGCLFLFSSCERRPLEGCDDTAYALIPVRIDWSQAGFPLLPESKDPDDYVHRVSLRFFPKSGGEAFDRYLETNVSEGEIMVPVGEYHVVVFNESVFDVSWNDQIRFTDINDFERFAANKVIDTTPQDYFEVPQDQPLVKEPPRLASWSLGDFRVTYSMTEQYKANAGSHKLTAEVEVMYQSLTQIVMYPLTYDVNILAQVTNLKYAQQIMGHKKGFSRKVYMASRQTEKLPSSFLFKFNGRKWTDADKVNGTTEWTFRSFGKMPSEIRYLIDLHVILTDGTEFKPEIPLSFDVTDQVMGTTTKAPIHQLHIVLRDIVLPVTEGGVDVGDWDDEDIIIQ